MNKQIIITILLAFILGVITAQADIVKGRVVDSETKEPLPDASVTLTQKYEFASSNVINIYLRFKVYENNSIVIMLKQYTLIILY